MESVKKLAKITTVLILTAFVFRFVYVNIILPMPFRHELEICLENTNRVQDEMAMEIAKDLCFDIYQY